MVTYCVRRCLKSARCLLAAYRTSRRLSQSSTRSRAITEAYCLNGRGLVQFAGRDTVDFLQGLVTCDVTGLAAVDNGVSVQYSMMLNVQGRVLFDLILYNHSKLLDEVCFLVECDALLKESFVKTAKQYRIRKKVDISDVSDEYKVWSIPSSLDPTQPLTGQDQQDVNTAVNDSGAKDASGAIFCVPDPRVPLFGQRVILKVGDESLLNIDNNKETYNMRRYRWGIPEGPTDLPPGNCLPLESNLTIMNGVSFLKGCYIGQELTARTHHTGVIRKRLLPLIFNSPLPPVDSNAQIITDKGMNAGRFRAAAGKFGLGLLRLEHYNKTLFISAKDGSKIPVHTYKPGWWPEELLK